MAKGQLHSTGTICKAELRCPIEADGGQHFDSVDELVDHTARTTGTDATELRDVISSGVKPSEAVAMASSGVLGGAAGESVTRAAPKKPAEVKELSDFDPSVHSVFSNAAARKDPAVAAKALKRELAHGDWMAELAERHEDAVSEGTEDLFPGAGLSVKESEARQGAMAREMKWLADNDESYAAKLPRGVRSRLDRLTEEHAGVSIGTVRKAPAPKA